MAGEINVGNLRGNSPNFRVSLGQNSQLDISSDFLINNQSSIHMPSGTTSERPDSYDAIEASVRINTESGGLEVFQKRSITLDVGRWYAWDSYLEPAESIGSETAALGTFENPAPSATALKNELGDAAVNGAYFYTMDDGTVLKLWTDFETYPRYAFVMATRVWNGSQNQYLTTDENVDDLGLEISGAPATRHAKMSDAHMNYIIEPNTVRWVMMGNGSAFYRLDDDPQWYSNHGQNQTCTYTRGFYNAYATPSANPVWDTTFDSAYESCGGLHDGSWLPLSGIHINDGTYFGGYSGSNAARVAPPSPYNGVNTGGDSEWSRNGWVLLSW